jgi:hypothetical protein
MAGAADHLQSRRSHHSVSQPKTAKRHITPDDNTVPFTFTRQISLESPLRRPQEMHSTIPSPDPLSLPLSSTGCFDSSLGLLHGSLTLRYHAGAPFWRLLCPVVLYPARPRRLVGRAGNYRLWGKSGRKELIVAYLITKAMPARFPTCFVRRDRGGKFALETFCESWCPMRRLRCLTSPMSNELQSAERSPKTNMMGRRVALSPACLRRCCAAKGALCELQIGSLQLRLSARYKMSRGVLGRGFKAWWHH